MFWMIYQKSENIVLLFRLLIFGVSSIIPRAMKSTNENLGEKELKSDKTISKYFFVLFSS